MCWTMLASKPPFPNRHSEWLFQVDIESALQCEHRSERVMMVRRGDDHRVELFTVKHLTIGPDTGHSVGHPFLGNDSGRT